MTITQAIPLTPFQLSQVRDDDVQDISLGVEAITVSSQAVQALPEENSVILDRDPGVLPSFTDEQRDVRVGILRGGLFYPVWIEWVNGRPCVRGMNYEGNMFAIPPSEVRDGGFVFQSKACMTLEELIAFFPKPVSTPSPNNKKKLVKKVVVAGGSAPPTPPGVDNI